MDKFYTIFNTKIVELLNDLIRIFPEDNDFKMYKNAVNLVKLANEKKLLEFYNMFVTDEYKDHINNKNEKFFLNHDYNDILNSNELKQELDGDINNKIVNKLKGYWSLLSPENREIIWNYFGLFIKISDKVKGV
jgi:hypothetical protein